MRLTERKNPRTDYNLPLMGVLRLLWVIMMIHSTSIAQCP